LVQQILAFSRQSDQKKKLIRVSPIVKETTKFLRATLPTTIEIHQNTSLTSDLIFADPTQFHQVLMNLCTNAGHAMEDNRGMLEVLLDEVHIAQDDLNKYPDLKTGSYLRLTVKDTGHGINKEILDKIFEPYFTTKEMGGGTGLGLAVVHGIVKSHNGAITVSSEVGKGTTFHVLFPLMEQMEAIENTDEESPIPTGNETILFVDDEEGLVYAGKRMLERLGYSVVGVTSADDALDTFKLAKDTYDLVITDKTMPHMTGFDLTQEIKNIRSDIPVIMCTGLTAETDLEKANDVGIQEFVMKPLDKRLIAETIRKVLDKKV